MKKVTMSIIIAVILIIGGVFIKKSCINKYNMNLKNDDMHYTVKYKGIFNGKDFALDSKGNYYIAYKNSIQLISERGRSFNILKDKKLNINSMEYFEDKLYFTSNCEIYYFDLVDKKLVTIRDDLPNFGDYKDSIIKVSGENLYISIGAATNSGVVGEDNKWVKPNTYNCDITPFDIKVNGLLFGSGNTGGFAPANTSNIAGQVVTGNFPGNSSIIKINIKSGKAENFAWGIRNVKGMDFDSKGKLYASVGGMEDRGLRPIKNDFDYLFKIDKKGWYGWPDYSGGDPINSPRFDNSMNSFIIQNPPTINPPAPLYQHKYLNTLGSLAIDKNGDIGKKDSIYFYDEKVNSILELNKEGKLQDKIQLNNKSDISSIKFSNKSLILLDSKEGYIVEVSKIIETKVNKYYSKFFYGVIIIILLGIIYIIKISVTENTK